MKVIFMQCQYEQYEHLIPRLLLLPSVQDGASGGGFQLRTSGTRSDHHEAVKLLIILSICRAVEAAYSVKGCAAERWLKIEAVVI